MTRREIAGSEIYLRQWRHGTAERPVLMLHCALAHGGAFGLLAEAMTDVAITAPDLPGHGNSADLPAAADLHDLSTAQARSLARDLAQGGPVDLLGHSFGATVALRLALETPELVRSLTLIEPPFFAAAKGSAAYAASHQHNRTVEALMAQDQDAAAALFHAEWGGGLPYGALPERQRRYVSDRMALVMQPGAVLQEDREGLLRIGRLEGIAMPVLLVEGAKSPAVAAAIIDHLAARLPNAERLVVEGAAHMLPITHPQALAQAWRALRDRS